MTATIVQALGAETKTFGPFPVFPGPDFDMFGIDGAQIFAILRRAKAQGAQVGYCQVIYKDENGEVVGEETGVV